MGRASRSKARLAIPKKATAKRPALARLEVIIREGGTYDVSTRAR